MDIGDTAMDEMVGGLDTSALVCVRAIIHQLAPPVLWVMSLVVLLRDWLRRLPLNHNHAPAVWLHLLELAGDRHFNKLLLLLLILVLIVVCVDPSVG